MLPVVIVSQRPRLLEELISASLAVHGGVLRCSDRSIASPARAEFAVISGANADTLDLYRGIIVISEPPPLKRLRLSNTVLPVLLSSDRRALRLLRGCSNPAICCGCAATDSLSISSITNDKLLVSVQRELTTVYGEPVEPAEYVVSAPKVELHSALLSTAVLIAAGKKENLCVLRSC